MLTTLELIQCNKLVPSVLIGGTRVGPLMGQSGDDDIPKRKDMQLFIVSWEIVNANVPFMEDFRVKVDELMARLMPKSLILAKNESTFNSTLLGLRP